MIIISRAYLCSRKGGFSIIYGLLHNIWDYVSVCEWVLSKCLFHYYVIFTFSLFDYGLGSWQWPPTCISGSGFSWLLAT